jgi:EmrB/QacA subfamily drug resistance transporter
MSAVSAASAAPRGSNTLALAGLIVAVSMTTIDQTIVALSAPTIESDLGISHGAMQWAVNAYLLATAAFFLLGGRLSDVLGHKRMALIGIAGFGATSLLCSLAPDGGFAASWLIGARVLQGIAGALMYPAAVGIVVEGFSREGRAKAMATFFGITGAMTALGPIAGGYLTQWTWRSVFWVNVPLAIVSFVIVARTATPSERRRERVDLRGALLIAVGLGLVVFGLQQAGSSSWTSAQVLAALIAGVAFVIAFVLVEARTNQPLVKLAVFRDRGFLIASISILFASVAFLSTFFFLSVYGQVSLQLNAATTGGLFLKFFVGFVIAAQIGSRRFDRMGARSVLFIGGLVGAAGFAWLADSVTKIPADPGDLLNAQTWPIALAGAGIGFMLSAASTDAVNRSIGASYGEVTAISQTMRNFGGALGIALLTTVVTDVLTTKITDSFTRLGATAADARAAVGSISGAETSSDKTLTELPSGVRTQILHAVQTGYADSVAWAFAGAAIAMGVVALLALFYPKDQVSAHGVDAVAEPVTADTVGKVRS